jgi:hypothetical protein
MDITQSEAKRLLNLPKIFAVADQVIEFSNQMHFTGMFELNAQTTKDQFILDIERGNKRRARLKFQTRAKKIIVLARIDINGKPHRNPPDAPHRPGERFSETHIHLYHEDFGDKIAFLPSDLESFSVPKDKTDSSWLIAFLKFCNVAQIPTIQETI